MEALVDPFDGLTRIGIDEISYKRGHLYLVIVIDHDTGRLVWAAPGQSMATLQVFFDKLGPQRCAGITHVSADGAAYIAKVATKNCPEAVRGIDPFYADAPVMPMSAVNGPLGRRGVVGGRHNPGSREAGCFPHWKEPGPCIPLLIRLTFGSPAP